MVGGGRRVADAFAVEFDDDRDDVDDAADGDDYDADGNNKLDGCELVKSLIHWHGNCLSFNICRMS